jgi:phosphoglycerol transferase MdoB-like AlkP superfamily enzyme
LLLMMNVLAAGLAMAVRSDDRDVSLAVLFCVSVITVPISWIHTLALLLLPFAVALRNLRHSGFPFFQTTLWAVLAGLLLIPDYALINLLPRFNINHSGIGPVTVSFWPGLLTLIPLVVTLCLMALVYWSANQTQRSAPGSDAPGI